jgi:hypothetical protein
MRKVLCILSLIIVSATVAQATVIDDFSVDTSSKYSSLYIAANPPKASYGRTGEQFSSIPGSNSATDFLRNDGYLFNVGDTISIEVYGLAPAGTYQTGGLCLNKSLTQVQDEWEYYVQIGGVNTYWLDFGTAPHYTVTDLSFANGPLKISLTRTSDTVADITYSYHTTSGGTAIVNRQHTGLSAGAYYFGIGGYDGGFRGALMDNLSYTTVPEPSMLALLVVGLSGLLAYAWRKRK